MVVTLVEMMIAIMALVVILAEMVLVILERTRDTMLAIMLVRG